MTTITTQTNCQLIGMAKAMNTAWCVYEHWLPVTPGEPPELIYIGACRLNEVFNMRTARNNSDWTNIFATDREIMLSIVMIGPNQREIIDASIKHAKRQSTMPRCNLHGFNMFGQSRRVICNNGTEYPTQYEAAQALGLSQGAISRHLKGELASVKGFTFSYVGTRPTNPL